MSGYRFAAFPFVLLLSMTGIAHAVDVEFDGTVTNSCTLAIGTPGAIGLSGTSNNLSSENAGGVTAIVNVTSIGANSVTVGAPSLSTTPGTYDSTGEAVQVKYTGTAGLSLVDQDYTATETSFGVDTIAISTLLVDVQATNDNGFDEGDYTIATTVTCD